MPSDTPADPASVLTHGAPSLGSGPGAADEIGYGEGGIPDPVEGTMEQRRLLATAPEDTTEDDMAGIPHRPISPW